MIKIILLLTLLVPFKGQAFEKSDCSLKCKGRFYSQKGMALLKNMLADKKPIDQKMAEEIMADDNADKSLTIGCLMKCKAKDIRDVFCYILSQENDESFMKNLAQLIKNTKKSEDFGSDHENSCKKVLPKKADNITKNYEFLRESLGPKSS